MKEKEIGQNNKKEKSMPYKKAQNAYDKQKKRKGRITSTTTRHSLKRLPVLGGKAQPRRLEKPTRREKVKKTKEARDRIGKEGAKEE